MTLDIETAIEVGVYRGGFHISRPPFFIGSIQTSISQWLIRGILFWDLSGFPRKLNLEKAIPATSNDFAGQAFDFVFIDGDHRYEGAIPDYRNLGIHAKKAVGFHDIHDHSPDSGTVQVWNEMKSELCATQERIRV